MQIVINISSKHAAVFGTILFIITVSLVADYASSAAPGLTQWHMLSEITNDSAGNVRITTASGKINASFIDGDASQWITSGSNIYYNAGNVGIGTATPARKLHVTDSGISISNDAVDRSSIYWDTAGNRLVIKVN